MRFLADENFPVPSSLLLSELGYDIISIVTNLSGISDSDVIEYANATQRTILTFDKDYGELIFKRGLRPKFGVLFLRLHQFTPEEPAHIVDVLLSKNTLEFHNTLFVYDGLELRKRTYL